jgi:hypothetical protein
MNKKRPTLTGLAPARGACAPTRPGLVAPSTYREGPRPAEQVIAAYTERVALPRRRVIA